LRPVNMDRHPLDFACVFAAAGDPLRTQEYQGHTCCLGDADHNCNCIACKLHEMIPATVPFMLHGVHLHWLRCSGDARATNHSCNLHLNSNTCNATMANCQTPQPDSCHVLNSSCRRWCLFLDAAQSNDGMQPMVHTMKHGNWGRRSLIKLLRWLRLGPTSNHPRERQRHMCWAQHACSISQWRL
jgi:hypothetical protein